MCATLDQLCRAGYAELSVDAVARVARVNKTTIYRRWPTKSELVIAAIVAAKTRALPFRPIGDLRRDLVALLDAKARRMATPRQRAIAYAINNLDPAVSEALVAELRRHRYTIPRDIIEHAIASGELPRDVDAELLAELLCAPICHRALVMCEPVPKKFVEQTVAIVLAGVPSSAPHVEHRRAFEAPGAQVVERVVRARQLVDVRRSAAGAPGARARAARRRLVA